MQSASLTLSELPGDILRVIFHFIDSKCVFLLLSSSKALCAALAPSVDTVEINEIAKWFPLLAAVAHHLKNLTLHIMDVYPFDVSRLSLFTNLRSLKFSMEGPQPRKVRSGLLEALQGLTLLRKLDLSDLPLQNLTMSNFSQLQHLEELCVDNIKLSSPNGRNHKGSLDVPKLPRLRFLGIGVKLARRLLSSAHRTDLDRFLSYLDENVTPLVSSHPHKYSFLAFACQTGDPIEWMLERKDTNLTFHPSYQHEGGPFPLMMTHSEERAIMLIKHGADVNARHSFGLAVHSPIRSWITRKDVLSAILEKGLEIDYHVLMTAHSAYWTVEAHGVFNMAMSKLLPTLSTWELLILLDKFSKDRKDHFPATVETIVAMLMKREIQEFVDCAQSRLHKDNSGPLHLLCSSFDFRSCRELVYRLLPVISPFSCNDLAQSPLSIALDRISGVGLKEIADKFGLFQPDTPFLSAPSRNRDTCFRKIATSINPQSAEETEIFRSLIRLFPASQALAEIIRYIAERFEDSMIEWCLEYKHSDEDSRLDLSKLISNPLMNYLSRTGKLNPLIIRLFLRDFQDSEKMYYIGIEDIAVERIKELLQGGFWPHASVRQKQGSDDEISCYSTVLTYWCSVSYEDPALRTVEPLLVAGADPNAFFDGAYSPLTGAIREQHAFVVKLLIKHGADVNKPDGRGIFPLVENSISGCDSRINHALLNAGASKSVASMKQEDRLGILEALFLHGDEESDVVEILVKQVPDLARGHSALCLLATIELAWLSDISQLLLRAGADPFALDEHGRSCMYYAIKANNELIISHLMAWDRQHPQNRPENLDLANAKCQKDGTTPLLTAIAFEKDGLVRLLVDRCGANVNLKPNAEKEYPLIAAVNSCDADLVRLLLEAGADPKVTSREGKTAWQVAKELKIPDVLDALRRFLSPQDMMPAGSRSVPPTFRVSAAALGNTTREEVDSPTPAPAAFGGELAKFPLSTVPFGGSGSSAFNASSFAPPAPPTSFGQLVVGSSAFGAPAPATFGSTPFFAPVGPSQPNSLLSANPFGSNNSQPPSSSSNPFVNGAPNLSSSSSSTSPPAFFKGNKPKRKK